MCWTDRQVIDISDERIELEVRADSSQLKNDLNKANKIIESSAQKSEKAIEEIGKTAKKSNEEAAEASRKFGDSTGETAEDVEALRAEVETLKNQTEELKSKLEEASETTNSFGKVGKAAATTFAAVGAAALTVGVNAMSGADGLDRANKQVQAALGITADEAERYEDVIKSIYANNYGEDFEDIADKISLVKEQMSDISDAELQKCIESAYLLDDVYAIDVQESIRGANAMVKQFGISATEAYNLIAQGAEKGLNQNGDLADQLAEYATYYANLGFSAEDAMNMLAAGAESGVYQIDKLNDAVKEFSIRAIDGSEATAEGFAKLGLDADMLAAAFAEGGEESAKAFNMVIGKIAEMEDAVEQDAVGVALFGTMWEDVGAAGVTALADIGNGIDATRDKLSEMDSVKHTSLSDMLESTKRSVELLLIPLGEQLLPIISELIEAILPVAEDILPDLSAAVGELIPVFGNIIKDILPAVTDLLGFLCNVTVGLVSIIYDFRDVLVIATVALVAYKAAMAVSAVVSAASKALNGMTDAQHALNKAMSLNPIGLVTAAVAALAMGVGALIGKLNSCSEEVQQMIDKQEQLQESIDHSIASNEAEMTMLRQKAERYEELRNKIELTAAEENELKGLADDIQGVLGDEIKVVDKLTGKYADLTDEISRYIDKKNQEVRLSAYEEAAKEAYIALADIDNTIHEKNQEMMKMDKDGVNPFEQYSYIGLANDINQLNESKGKYQAIIDEYNRLLTQQMQSGSQKDDAITQKRLGTAAMAEHYSGQSLSKSETTEDNPKSDTEDLAAKYELELQPTETQVTADKASKSEKDKTSSQKSSQKSAPNTTGITAGGNEAKTNIISITSYIPTVWDDEAETNEKLKMALGAELVGNSSTGKIVSGLEKLDGNIASSVKATSETASEATLNDVVKAVKELKSSNEKIKASFDIEVVARDLVIGKAAIADINEITRKNGRTPLEGV